MADESDLESLVHLESTFFEKGYQEGYEHGRLTGLAEGRACGARTGFDMWAELGYYEGFAATCLAVYSKQGREQDRAVHHMKQLIDLVAQFPFVDRSKLGESDLDVAQMLQKTRSKYKVLCRSLGLRPDLPVAENIGPAAQGDLSAKQRIWPWIDHTTKATQPDLSF